MSSTELTRWQAADRPGSSEYEPWVAQRVIAGWTPQAIATAAGVSLRTAQRWCSTFVGIELVAVAGWSARFVIRRDQPPLRLEAWHR